MNDFLLVHHIYLHYIWPLPFQLHYRKHTNLCWGRVYKKMIRFTVSLLKLQSLTFFCDAVKFWVMSPRLWNGSRPWWPRSNCTVSILLHLDALSSHIICRERKVSSELDTSLINRPQIRFLSVSLWIICPDFSEQEGVKCDFCHCSSLFFPAVDMQLILLFYIYFLTNLPLPPGPLSVDHRVLMWDLRTRVI